MEDRITICAGCRPGEGEAMVARLRDGLAQAGLPTVVALADCMVVCSQPVTVSVRAEGKAAYLFAGVDPMEQTGDLVAFARLYAASWDGIIEDARPCGDLRFRLLGRIPA